MDIISSVENQHIKVLKSLAEKKYRKFYGEYVIEGVKSVREAISAEMTLTKLFVSECKLAEYAEIIRASGLEPIVVSDKLFGKISDTTSPQGIIAQVEMKPSGKFNPGKKPFLVLDRVADPGNLGTIIRSAVATGFNDIVLLDTVDPYNPKTVRSTASGIFFVNFYPLTTDELIKTCKEKGIKILVADASGLNIYTNPMPKEEYCLVIANEANGPCGELREAADITISLPMKREMESLNAGVCASIMMYQFGYENI